MVRTLTAEENEKLTRVGKGTPMGELLRHYWWPVAFSDHLKEKPTLIRLLCEDLVLFRSNDGKVGLVGAHCPHRGANLCAGSVTGEGIRCRYHGWVTDRSGRVTEVPGEDDYNGDIKHLAYPVQELGGLIFAYLGSKPPPVLPHYHILAADGRRNAMIQSFNDSNWLQSAENGIDPLHPSFLHPDVWSIIRPLPVHDWTEVTPHGIVSKQVRKGRRSGEAYFYTDHQMAMPGVIFGGDTTYSYGGDPKIGELPAGSCRYSVPIDDFHTMNIRVYFRPSDGGEPSPIEVRKDVGRSLEIEPYKEYRNGQNELGYTLPAAIAEQDATVLDSMGPIFDRRSENLVRGDGAIAKFREILLQQLAAVERGEDPIGIVRDSKPEMIILAGEYKPLTNEERLAMIAKVPPEELLTISRVVPKSDHADASVGEMDAVS